MPRLWTTHTHLSGTSSRLLRSESLKIVRNSPRRAAHTRQSQYQPFVPPSPESLGKARPAKQYPRTLKWGKRMLYLSLGIGSIWIVDKQFYASSLTRSARTFGFGLVVATDYKLNFREKPLFGGTVTDLHRRSAERLFDVLRTNGGLYLKIGSVLSILSLALSHSNTRQQAGNSHAICNYAP
jgi:aarF domain-containing kinase